MDGDGGGGEVNSFTIIISTAKQQLLAKDKNFILR